MNVVISEVVFRERILCKHLSLSLLHSLQENSKDEGRPPSVYCPNPILCLQCKGTIHPIPVSFLHAWLRVVLQFTIRLCPSTGWDMESTVSVFIRQGLWSLIMCIFRVGRSLSFVVAQSATVGLSCYA